MVKALGNYRTWQINSHTSCLCWILSNQTNVVLRNFYSYFPETPANTLRIVSLQESLVFQLDFNMRYIFCLHLIRRSEFVQVICIWMGCTWWENDAVIFDQNDSENPKNYPIFGATYIIFVCDVFQG